MKKTNNNTTKATKTTKANKSTGAKAKAANTVAARPAKVTRPRKTNKAGLPQCFLNEGENSTWLATGGVAVEKRLPYVPAKYEKALKESGIPYRYAYIPDKYKKGEQFAVCEYWNPECPMQEKNLPVYIKSENSDDTYLLTGDYVTREVVSGKVAHMANKLESVVKYACAKADLDGKIATVVRRSKNSPQEVNLESADGKSIKILQAYKDNGDPTGVCGMFDMNEVAKVHYIEMHVPEDLAGTVIGKGGQNKKYWDEMLGGKNVVIVAE